MLLSRFNKTIKHIDSQVISHEVYLQFDPKNLKLKFYDGLENEVVLITSNMLRRRFGKIRPIVNHNEIKLSDILYFAGALEESFFVHQVENSLSNLKILRKMTVTHVIAQTHSSMLRFRKFVPLVGNHFAVNSAYNNDASFNDFVEGNIVALQVHSIFNTQIAKYINYSLNEEFRHKFLINQSRNYFCIKVDHVGLGIENLWTQIRMTVECLIGELKYFELEAKFIYQLLRWAVWRSVTQRISDFEIFLLGKLSHFSDKKELKFEKFFIGCNIRLLSGTKPRINPNLQGMLKNIDDVSKDIYVTLKESKIDLISDGF